MDEQQRKRKKKTDDPDTCGGYLDEGFVLAENLKNKKNRTTTEKSKVEDEELFLVNYKFIVWS